MKDNLLLKCLGVSVAVHVVAATCFFLKPLHFHPNFLTSLGKTPPTLLEQDAITPLKKEALLEESFRDFVVLSPQSSEPHNIKPLAIDGHVFVAEKPLSIEQPLLLPTSTPSIALEELPTPSLQTSSEVAAKLVESSPNLGGAPIDIHRQTIQPFDQLEFPSVDLQPPVLGLSDFEFHASDEKFQLPRMSPTSVPSPLSSPLQAQAELSISAKTPAVPETSLSQKPIASAPLKLKSSPVISSADLSSSLMTYGLPQLNSLDWNQAFDVEVKTLQREEGGFLFSLTFYPKLDLSQYRLKQNYYFLIDRSNSIEKHRYQTFKRAVLRAIASMREGDNFNIIIFDSKVARLSENPIPFNKKHQRFAEDFLEKQPHGNYGAATDIYSSLEKVIPLQVSANEAHTAILITDGDSKLKTEKQRALINKWLASNENRVTLYTAAVGEGNNIPILELLGTAGRGSLLYSDTHTAFPRKLAKLIMDLRSPIAKEMNLTITSSDPTLNIFPSSTRLPSLFSDHPYVLYGSAQTLSDFTLLLEGTNKNDLLSIKKTISFAKAKPGNRLLAKQWAAEQARFCYEEYLKEGRPDLLHEAQTLLLLNREAKR